MQLARRRSGLHNASVSRLTRFALLTYGVPRPAWLAGPEFDGGVELPPEANVVARLDELARERRGDCVLVRMGPEAMAAAYRHVLELDAGTSGPRCESALVLDWPDPEGDDETRPAVVGVDLDWLPGRNLGGGRDCFPSGPSGSGTANPLAAN